MIDLEKYISGKLEKSQVGYSISFPTSPRQMLAISMVHDQCEKLQLTCDGGVGNATTKILVANED
jgi:hypothetical protein